jgi:hypothetical protein
MTPRQTPAPTPSTPRFQIGEEVLVSDEKGGFFRATVIARIYDESPRHWVTDEIYLPTHIYWVDPSPLPRDVSYTESRLAKIHLPADMSFDALVHSLKGGKLRIKSKREPLQLDGTSSRAQAARHRRLARAALEADSSFTVRMRRRAEHLSAARRIEGGEVSK